MRDKVSALTIFATGTRYGTPNCGSNRNPDEAAKYNFPSNPTYNNGLAIEDEFPICMFSNPIKELPEATVVLNHTPRLKIGE
jgi:hypothetical protein